MGAYSRRFKLLLTIFCFVSYTWIKLIPRDAGSAVPLDLQRLHERVSVAEEMERQVIRNLSSILEHLRNMSKAANPTQHTGTTISSVMLLQPNKYLYLPHLKEHPESLIPNIVLGRGRSGVSMVLGVPTVKRDKQSYLVNTLNSLLQFLTSSQRRDLLIIVFIAETDSNYVKSIAETIKKNFPRDVRSGLLEVISPAQYYYPDFTNLTETLGDSKDRVKWRVKQILDFCFLMLYAQNKGTYYVQLEDDIIAKASYYDDMKTFASERASGSWLYLEFSQLGFIGKLFRTSDLPMIAEFFLMFHRDKPIDWLLDHILWVKVCNPEKDEIDCSKQKALLRQRHKTSLFQHVGLHSSLAGKLQHLVDNKFEKHRNPSAKVSSSLKYYQKHSLARAYTGEDFFWALTPIKGDYILFNFLPPIHISGYLFRSGNIDNADKFYNTTVEVLRSNASTQNIQVNGSSTLQQESNSFIVIGEFENGVAQGEIEVVLQPVSALRLVVHANASTWALMSEILIKI